MSSSAISSLVREQQIGQALEEDLQGTHFVGVTSHGRHHSIVSFVKVEEWRIIDAAVYGK